MSDFLVSIGVGATLQGPVGTVFGSADRHLDQLGATVRTLDERMARVKGVRAMETALGRTRAEARAAGQRAARLARAIRGVREPSEGMRRAFASARDESTRLRRRLGEQTRALVGQRRELRAAGDAVSDLERRERNLGRELEQQTRRCDRLGTAMARSRAARERRGELRGQLFETAAVGTAVLTPIAAGIRAAVRFEWVMADVGKVVDFPSPDGLREMGGTSSG